MERSYWTLCFRKTAISYFKHNIIPIINKNEEANTNDRMWNASAFRSGTKGV